MCLIRSFVYAFLHLIVLTALDSYLTIPIMYVYGFADCVDNSKHMQGYIRSVNTVIAKNVSRKEIHLETEAVKPSS